MRPRKENAEEQVSLTLICNKSFKTQLQTYCANHPMQPPLALIIRAALREYMERHPNRSQMHQDASEDK